MTLDPEFQPLVEFPAESPSAEYKDWLDLASTHGRATLAKHAMAIANHGGGHIILGFSRRNSTSSFSPGAHGPPGDHPGRGKLRCKALRGP